MHVEQITAGICSMVMRGCRSACPSGDLLPIFGTKYDCYMAPARPLVCASFPSSLFDLPKPVYANAPAPRPTIKQALASTHVRAVDPTEAAGECWCHKRQALLARQVFMWIFVKIPHHWYIDWLSLHGVARAAPAHK